MTQYPFDNSDLEWHNFQLDEISIGSLIEKFNVPEAVAVTMTAKQTRPRTTVYDEGILVILRGVNLNENSDPEDMIALRLWATEKQVITVHIRPLQSVAEMADEFAQNKGPSTIGHFIVRMIKKLFYRMNDVTYSLTEELDDIEDSILNTNIPIMARELTELRIKTTHLLRHISPQKDVVEVLIDQSSALFNSQELRKLHNAKSDITRITEELSTVRDRANILRDEADTFFDKEMNKNGYYLTAIAAIFLPLTILTGMFGINVGGMPWANDPMGFWWFAIMCTGVAIVGAILFKIRRML